MLFKGSMPSPLPPAFLHQPPSQSYEGEDSPTAIAKGKAEQADMF